MKLSITVFFFFFFFFFSGYECNTTNLVAVVLGFC
jgi:hypothetical protein